MFANHPSVGAAGSQFTELERARRQEKLRRLAFLQEALAEIRYTHYQLGRAAEDPCRAVSRSVGLRSEIGVVKMRGIGTC